MHLTKSCTLKTNALQLVQILINLGQANNFEYTLGMILEKISSVLIYHYRSLTWKWPPHKQRKQAKIAYPSQLLDLHSPKIRRDYRKGTIVWNGFTTLYAMQLLAQTALKTNVQMCNLTLPFPLKQVKDEI